MGCVHTHYPPTVVYQTEHCDVLKSIVLTCDDDENPVKKAFYDVYVRGGMAYATYDEMNQACRVAREYEHFFNRSPLSKKERKISK